MFDREMENTLQGLFVRITHQYFVKNYHQMMNLGIHPGQLPMIRLLSFEDGLTQREIARRLNIRPPTVTVTIRRLERSGLLCRRSDERDRRASRISLTELGREKADEIKKILMKNEEIMFEGFSESERCLLRRFFREMLDNVKKIEVEEIKGEDDIYV